MEKRSFLLGRERGALLWGRTGIVSRGRLTGNGPKRGTVLRSGEKRFSLKIEEKLCSPREGEARYSPAVGEKRFSPKMGENLCSPTRGDKWYYSGGSNKVLWTKEVLSWKGQ